MSSTRSRALALVTLGALLLAFTGCGSDDTASTASAPATTASPSSGIEKTAFVDGLVSAMKAQSSAEARLTFGTTVTADATFAYGEDQPRARISAEVFGQRIEVVVVDGAFFLKQSGSAKFVKLSADDPSLSLFGGFSDLDPQAALTSIADGITSVRTVGVKTLDGQELTQYAVTLDGTALGSGMLAAVPGVDLSGDLVVDLYVDADNLVHRAEAELGQNDLTLVVTNWGKAVTITAPSAKEILQN